MRTKSFHLFMPFVIMAAMWLTVSPAAAGQVEITPFVGYTAGGGFTNATTGRSLTFDETTNYGLMLDFKQAVDPRKTGASFIELYFSKQPTSLKVDQSLFVSGPSFDIDVEYYHIGGTYGSDDGMVRPFVLGTFGATRMVPQQSGLDSELKFSISFGGGVKVYFTERIGLRLDGRWFGTIFDGSGSAFCTNGGCLVSVQGDLLSQFTANGGLILAF